MNTFERLNGIFREVFGDDTLRIRSEMTANDVDGWDSFAHQSLITAIELTFGIEITDSEVVRLVNVQSIVDLVRSKTGNE